MRPIVNGKKVLDGKRIVKEDMVERLSLLYHASPLKVNNYLSYYGVTLKTENDIPALVKKIKEGKISGFSFKRMADKLNFSTEEILRLKESIKII